MATRNVVPRADAEGSIGTTLKRWINIFLSSFLELGEIATPANPAANRLKCYAKDDAGTTKLYILDSAGLESDLTGGGGGNEYIEVKTQLGVPVTNLDIVTMIQGASVANPCHTWVERIAVSGSNTTSYLIFKVQIPSDFASFYAGTNLLIYVRSNDRANNTITLTAYRYNATIDAGVNGANIEPAADGTWQLMGDQLTGTYSAGEWIFFRVAVNLDSGDYYRIAEMYLRYTKA